MILFVKLEQKFSAYNEAIFTQDIFQKI